MGEELQPYFEGYIDAKMTARLLGIQKSTLYGLQRCGQGPKRYRFGRKNFYRPDEVRNWATSHLQSFGEGA